MARGTIYARLNGKGTMSIVINPTQDSAVRRGSRTYVVFIGDSEDPDEAAGRSKVFPADHTFPADHRIAEPLWFAAANGTTVDLEIDDNNTLACVWIPARPSNAT